MECADLWHAAVFPTYCELKHQPRTLKLNHLFFVPLTSPENSKQSVEVISGFVFATGLGVPTVDDWLETIESTWNFHWISSSVLQNICKKIIYRSHLSCVIFKQVCFIHILYKCHSCVWQHALPTHLSVKDSLNAERSVTPWNQWKSVQQPWAAAIRMSSEKVAEGIWKRWPDSALCTAVCQTRWWWLEMPPRLDAVLKSCASSQHKVTLERLESSSERRGEYQGGVEESERGAQHGRPERPAAVTKRGDMQMFISRLCPSGGSCWLASYMCRFQHPKSWWYGSRRHAWQENTVRARLLMSLPSNATTTLEFTWKLKQWHTAKESMQQRLQRQDKVKWNNHRTEHPVIRRYI